MTTKPIIATKQKRDPQNDSSVEKGVVEYNTKPSDLFKGIWSKGEKRLSANEIREQAWRRSKYQ